MRSMRSVRSVKFITAIGVLLASGACDWGPRGQGQLSGIVTSGAIPVGAVVLQISGPGVQGFSEAGQTRVFSAEPATDVHRVVLVTSDPDQVRFQVAVNDVQNPALTVVVIEAVDESNAAIANLSGIEVTLDR